MDNKFEEAKFWLPSEFLTENEILMGHGKLLKTEGRVKNEFYPNDYGPPVLGSPVESFEAESDEEDALVRQLRRTTLYSNLSQYQIERNWVPSGSPRLSAPMKTPNSCFTNTHFEQARMEQMARQQSSAMLNPQVKNGCPCCQNRGLRSGFGVGGFVKSNRCGRVVGQTVWSGLPNQYQGQVGSGMRMGRLGGSVKECAGTGVFLPRRYCSENPADSHKKSGCSSAWLPARVVESLNKKKVDDFNAVPQHKPHTPTQHHRFNAGILSDYNILMARRNAVLPQQRRNLQPEGSMNFEVRLPQEWTY